MNRGLCSRALIQWSTWDLRIVSSIPRSHLRAAAGESEIVCFVTWKFLMANCSENFDLLETLLPYSLPFLKRLLDTKHDSWNEKVHKRPLKRGKFEIEIEKGVTIVARPKWRCRRQASGRPEQTVHNQRSLTGSPGWPEDCPQCPFCLTAVCAILQQVWHLLLRSYFKRF